VIGQLRGRVDRCSPGQVVLDVAGVGYDVRIPLSTYYSLAGRDGGEVCLHIHTHVREDALLLYGFATLEERAAFELLIGISGVGPRTAMAILSGIGVPELRLAVSAQDRDRLQRIPGVGKKTAERLLLELRDKLGPEAASRATAALGESTAGGAVRADAVSALVNLGYARDGASRAVDGALREHGPAATLEVVLRAALGSLVR
jgi:Holliday junction DNA helicase RuvA